MTDDLVAHVDESIARALRGESALDEETLAIKGFSTPTMRHLVNNLCSKAGTVYLEVGAWFGASACAAMCGNKELSSFVVEDFSQDFSEPGVRLGLSHNLDVVLPKTGGLTFIEQPCYGTDLELITKPISIFFFDGEHSRPSQARALPYFFDALAPVFLFIVDDFGWDEVARGTRDALAELLSADKIRVEKTWVLTGEQKSDDKTWHNGVFLAVCSKV